ncbi:MAG: hypothetical protein JW820_09425, partial [Spirochaetales bacterium]|nr:hypothetical protein [Spirochaetales bacterium]
CRSEYGRNRRLGREIILNHLLEHYRSIDELIAGLPRLGYFAEGAVASAYVNRLALQHGLRLPICSGVYRILNREVEPLEAVKGILQGLGGGLAGGLSGSDEEV